METVAEVAIGRKMTGGDNTAYPSEGASPHWQWELKKTGWRLNGAKRAQAMITAIDYDDDKASWLVQSAPRNSFTHSAVST